MNEQTTLDRQAEPATGSACILVPLDGSAEAERALAVAERLAHQTSRSLVLVRVVPLLMPAHVYVTEPGGKLLEAYQELFVAEQRQAQEYLESLAQGPVHRSVSVCTVLVSGDDPSVALLDAIQRESVSLVVMTTHGRTGLARFAFGSVADRLVRYGRAPVLLLRSYGVQCRTDPLERVLVALDGSARAERAIDQCRMLLGGAIRELVLVRVVAATATERDIADAQQYLDEVAARHAFDSSRRNCSLSTQVVRGDPAEALLHLAEAECDLIAITTHGRAGVARWALGSVADHVLQGARVPLLLVRST